MNFTLMHSSIFVVFIIIEYDVIKIMAIVLNRPGSTPYSTLINLNWGHVAITLLLETFVSTSSTEMSIYLATLSTIFTYLCLQNTCTP